MSLPLRPMPSGTKTACGSRAVRCNQYHAKTYGADFRYEQFAPLFNEQLQKWEPEAWAELFAQAGARYVVLVTKHHDGFLMWNSRHANPRIPNWQASAIWRANSPRRSAPRA